MKRTIIHTSAAIALLLGIAACTQDEAGFLQEGAEGTPIVFTATGLNPAATATAGTRAPADGNWTGVQSVAVMMDGMVKTYNVTPSTADPTSATLTSTDPYYWTNHNDITVTAWWPYTAGETTPSAVKVKANQSARKDFEGSDLIVADGQTVTYGSPTLRFTHRTARVTIVLTDYTEGLASVRLTGLSTEGGNPDIIVPYDKGSNTYTAIVAPQSVAAGTAFITCTFTNGKTLVYKMKNATDWQAGGEYTYTVSLATARGYIIEDDGSYTVYNADGLMNIAELVNGGKTDINITLDKNIDLTGKAWTPIGTCIIDESVSFHFHLSLPGCHLDCIQQSRIGLQLDRPYSHRRLRSHQHHILIIRLKTDRRHPAYILSRFHARNGKLPFQIGTGTCDQRAVRRFQQYGRGRKRRFVGIFFNRRSADRHLLRPRAHAPHTQHKSQHVSLFHFISSLIFKRHTEIGRTTLPSV